jgi:hypothetical protein
MTRRQQRLQNGQAQEANQSVTPPAGTVALSRRRTLVRRYVPVVINGTPLLCQPPQTDTLQNMQQFMTGVMPHLDLCPPYQRDGCWSQKKQQNWIAAIMNESMSLPPFYVCKQTERINDPLWDALDCKQRVTAIAAFLNDEFPVKVVNVYRLADSTEEVEKKIKLLWSQIETDPEYCDLKDKFLFRRVSIVKFPHMEMEEREKVFSGLNSGVPLNKDEQIYCPFCRARRVYDHIFGEVFSDVAELMNSRVKNRVRFAHVRVAQDLLMLTTGKDLQQVVRHCDLNSKDRYSAAQYLNEKLRSMNFGYHNNVTDTVLNRLGLADKMSPLTSLAGILAGVFRDNPEVGRKKQKMDAGLSIRDIVDPLSFIYGMMTRQETSLTRLRDNKGLLAELLKKYYPAKTQREANQSTTDEYIMGLKYQILMNLFNQPNFSALRSRDVCPPGMDDVAERLRTRQRHRSQQE